MIDFGQSPDRFRSEYCERKPKLFQGALGDRPVDWSDVDELLHIVEAGLPAMRLFNGGQIDDSAYTDSVSEIGRSRRRLNKARFYEQMASGATLQVNWLELYMLAAKRLCLEVGRFAGTQTSANAYLSFAGNGSFGKHWDTHDVFVIQLIGRKRWRIYAPTFPLPLTYQTHDTSGHSCPADPEIELCLDEGDVLYVPRGWWHHVVPLDVGSFHLSVGSYAPTVFDYLVQTSAKFLEQQLTARRAFSVDDYRPAVDQLLAELPAVLLDESTAAGFARDWAARERMNAEFNLGALDRPARPLPDAALVSLATFRSRPLDGDRLTVNGRQLRLEPLNRAIVEALDGAGGMRLDALCDRLAGVSREALQRALLDLARYDIVTIEQR